MGIEYLWVCTEDVIDRATGLDMPAYVKVSKGALVVSRQPPEPKEHFAQVCLETKRDEQQIRVIVSEQKIK